MYILRDLTRLIATKFAPILWIRTTITAASLVTASCLKSLAPFLPNILGDADPVLF
jgi:hypothetical protein